MSSVLSHLFRLLIARLGLLLVSGDRRDAEILDLRHQLLVLQRQIDRPSFSPTDRTILAVLSRAFDRVGARYSAVPVTRHNKASSTRRIDGCGSDRDGDSLGRPPHISPQLVVVASLCVSEGGLQPLTLATAASGSPCPKRPDRNSRSDATCDHTAKYWDSVWRDDRNPVRHCSLGKTFVVGHHTLEVIAQIERGREVNSIK